MLLSERLTLYHGTAGYAARTILDEGLSADPPDRLHDADEPDLVALPGCYFTNRIDVAMRYAMRRATEIADEPVILTATITLAEALPDEDVIKFALEEAQAHHDRARALHGLLVGHSVQTHAFDRAVCQTMCEAFDNLEDGEEPTAFRDALDRTARAYAAMAREIHPRYLGGHDGHHTVRLPDGLPAEAIGSATQFWIEAGPTPRHGPVLENIRALKGRSLSKTVLTRAARALHRRRL